MKWYAGLETIVEENVPLADLTWYHLGGPARYFCRPSAVEHIREIVKRTRDLGLPLKVLGEGANVLVRDEGFDGIVIQLSKSSFGQTSTSGAQVAAGGATDLPDLVRRTVKAGLAGLECLAGIPGSVGGAVRMNAGGKYGDIGSAVSSVEFVDQAGEVNDWDRQQLDFHYRASNLIDKIITKVTFQLEPTEPGPLDLRYKEIWNFKKCTQPFTRNNAGCMFKNPEGFKAGELIDRAGLKGLSYGGASVCEKHANFIIAEPTTRTADILTLTQRIQQSVQEKFDVALELEVDVW